MRILRIYKLFRHFAGLQESTKYQILNTVIEALAQRCHLKMNHLNIILLQALLYTLKQAYKELGLLLIIISRITNTKTTTNTKCFNTYHY